MCCLLVAGLDHHYEHQSKNLYLIKIMDKSRSILITGANGGIGRELVMYLHDQGYERVACQYHNDSSHLKQIFGSDFDRYCFQADLTNEEHVAILRQRVNAEFGSIYGLVNLVGASTSAMSWKMSVDEFTKIINANLLTTFLTCREFIPELRNQNEGRIINTSSVVAYTGTVGASHYCAVKAGIVGFSKALALELSNKNITVNVMALGYFDVGLIDQLTPQMQDDVKMRTPIKRFGRVDEIGGLVRYLLSNEGGFTTGQVHHINGGLYL